MVPIPDPLDLAVERESDRVLVRVAGEVDAATSDELSRALRDAMTDSVRRVVLDVSAVNFIDSSGLRVLVQAHRSAGERETEFVLRGPSDTFRRLLDVTGLDDVFTIE